MSAKSKHVIIGTIICLATMGIFLLFQDLLPDVVPIQITASGEAGNTLPKPLVIYGMPIIFSIVNIIRGNTLAHDQQSKTLYFYIIPSIALLLTGATIYMGATLN